MRFQAHSTAFALLTAGPLLLFSSFLLFLGVWIGSWGWLVFSSLAVSSCLALVLMRVPVVIDPAARSIRRSWCLGPIPIVRRKTDLEGYDFVRMGPYHRQGGFMHRSVWRLLEPNYRVALFGESGAMPLASFYRRDKAMAMAERTATLLGLDVYDQTIGESY